MSVNIEFPQNLKFKLREDLKKCGFRLISGYDGKELNYCYVSASVTLYVCMSWIACYLIHGRSMMNNKRNVIRTSCDGKNI